ncbi:ankyrin repeat protein, putative [Trichomonas vaginalis G3]|uniref:Ankyrin repeat protein, putative n=1 Tax=Trichomonas vaginalis (strain ATCC PRA-98 / G3) TaxID=412133 RepID=A2DGY1_TRIV3|nr:proteasome regulatory particle assembly [Trichomonas vaginalis G3]EAY20291.1 ankyrin repeat protein, putative [Trichomonas vaginalis G3]KAI5529163.1 proteasome regulatory particle assembly [Trichomonas vaginalis G3]|eukprot:XP_001581277.1 ankyrin repeat protein [Trichomonas vaginalis G3]
MGKTALHYAAAKFCGKETAELLISHGANINEKDNDGYTALHYAAANFLGEKTVELLISHGANINETDNMGKTALKIAVEHQYNQIAKLLILHGAISDF